MTFSWKTRNNWAKLNWQFGFFVFLAFATAGLINRFFTTVNFKNDEKYHGNAKKGPRKLLPPLNVNFVRRKMIFAFQDGKQWIFGYFYGFSNFAPSYDEININRIVNKDFWIKPGSPFLKSNIGRIELVTNISENSFCKLLF